MPNVESNDVRLSVAKLRYLKKKNDGKVLHEFTELGITLKAKRFLTKQLLRILIKMIIQNTQEEGC